MSSVSIPALRAIPEVARVATGRSDLQIKLPKHNLAKKKAAGEDFSDLLPIWLSKGSLLIIVLERSPI